MSTKILQISLYCLIITLLFSFSKKENNTIQVQAKFGKRGAGCIGTGAACAIDLTNNRTRSQYDAAANTYLTENGKVVFEFLKNSISVSKAEEQFGLPYYKIEEEFEFSAALCSALKMKSNSYVIKKGTYPITESKGSYRIVF